MPEVLDLGEAFDGVYAVSECVAGSPLEDLDTDGWLHVMPSLLEVLDAMRGVELPGMGFGRWQADGTAPYSSWRDWLCAIAVGPADSRIHGWRERMVTIPGAEARFDAGYEKLTELVGACPELRHVIHGDLTAANVLVESGEITAVLDWGNSIAGDPALRPRLAHVLGPVAPRSEQPGSALAAEGAIRRRRLRRPSPLLRTPHRLGRSAVQRLHVPVGRTRS